MSSPDPVKFLLVDDLDENLRALEALLRREGLEIFKAKSGTEALELMLTHSFSLALLDVQMPEMDGFELAELMRGTERTRTIPIIFITAAATDEGRRFRGYEAGAVDYVFKPVDPLIVRSKAQVFFEIGRQNQELGRQRDELKSTAMQLGDALRRLQAHSDNSPMAIVEFDPDLRLVSWSKGAERMFGYSAKDMVGRPLAELNWLPEESMEELLAQLSGAMADETHYRGIDMVRTTHKNGGFVDCEWYGSVLRDVAKRPVSLNMQILDVTDRHLAEETQRLLIGELNHRVKNTLASVQAIATQTLRHTRNPEDFSTTFSGRIQSLSQAHAMLSETTWQGAALGDLVRDQLRLGTMDEARLSVSGPEVQLAPATALRLALIIHELSTNAGKYGALAGAHGRVELSWAVKGDQLHILWRETGGPPVKAPLRRGFGTTLIEQSLRADGGSAIASYASEGVSWDMTITLTPSETSDLQRRIAAASVAPPPSQNTGKGQRNSLAGRAVLVIEDEPLVALELVSILEDAGARVVGPVGTIEEAIALTDSETAEIAFLDGNLHGHPVDEVAAALTRHNIPFAFVTGYGRQSLPIAFAHAPLLGKPFSPVQLLSTARDLLAPRTEVVQLRPEARA